jgi:hypothetical protein
MFQSSTSSAKPMKRSILLLVIMVSGLTFSLVSCKKTPDVFEKTPEELAREDSAFNSALINKLGAIYMTEKYPAGATNIPLATFTFGKDSLSYMGNTDANGKPALVSGYIYFNSKDNTRYTMAKADNGKTLMFGSINANNTMNNLVLTIGAYDDSLIKTTGYTLNTTAKTKQVLFEMVENKKSDYSIPTPAVKMLGTNDNVGDYMDSLVIKIKKLVIDAIDCLPDWGINKKLAELAEKKGGDKGGLSADDESMLDKLVNAHKEATAFFESISARISQLKASAGKNLAGAQKEIAELYNLLQKEMDRYSALLNYSLVKDKGDQQEVFYGDKPADMSIKTTSGSKPISIAGTCTISFNNKTQVLRMVTDKNGTGNISFPVIDAALESGGTRTLKADFTFGGVLNKQTVSFTETVKPKPRLSINIDASTNNQSADVGATVAKPLRVRVVDANNAAMPNIKINWTETTAGVSVAGLGSAQTVTDANGYSQNGWLLQGPVGTVHKATATIAASTNNSYLISSGSASFNATSVNTDSTALYSAAATGAWSCSWYDASSPLTASTVDEYELTAGGGGQRTKTSSASGSTNIPAGDIYNTVSWWVSRSGGSYMMNIVYKNRNIGFTGPLEKYPNLTYKAYPQIGSTNVYTIMQKR